MERIGEYLRDLSVSNTLQLLDEERRLIREKMRALRAAESAIRERVRHLQACAAVADGDPSLVELPPRPCLRLNADIARDEEMDFAIKRLHRRHEDTIRDLGGQKIGASIAPEDIRAGREGVYRSVFFLLKEGEAGDFTLPGGAHARLFYRGGYRQLGTRIAALLSWARARGLFPTGDVLELYHIDNRFTAREEEFLTELQVRVEPEKEETGEMTTDEIMLFDKWPNVLPLYAALREKLLCSLSGDDGKGGEDADLLPQPPCVRHGLAAVAAAARRAGGISAGVVRPFPSERFAARVAERGGVSGALDASCHRGARAGSGRRTAGAHRRGLSLRHGQVTGPFVAEARPCD